MFARRSLTRYRSCNLSENVSFERNSPSLLIRALYYLVQVKIYSQRTHVRMNALWRILSVREMIHEVHCQFKRTRPTLMSIVCPAQFARAPSRAIFNTTRPLRAVD